MRFAREKKEYFDSQKHFIPIVLNSGIDFSKYGWVTPIAKLIGQKPQKVGKWMKRCTYVSSTRKGAMTAKITITKQVCAHGSHGLYTRQTGGLMNAWLVHVDGKFWAAFGSRHDAREAVKYQLAA